MIAQYEPTFLESYAMAFASVHFVESLDELLADYDDAETDEDRRLINAMLRELYRQAVAYAKANDPHFRH